MSSYTVIIIGAVELECRELLWKELKLIFWMLF